MKVLVTGARGLLGTPLCRRLAEAGHDVVATDLPEVDVTRPDPVRATISTHRPDVVAHLAAWTAVDDCEADPVRAQRVNGDAAGHVAAATTEVGARLLHVSTDYVFDGRKDGAYVEDDDVGPVSVYGASKLAGERAVLDVMPGAWIARCQSIYGRGKTSFADAILARARSGEPLSVVDDQVVCPSYAEDLAAALVALVGGTPGGTYHVANSGSCTWYAFARAILDESGFRDVSIAPITARDLGRPAKRPANSRFSCARLERATGHRLRHWREALRDYLAVSDGCEETS